MVALIIVFVVELISCDIFFTLKNGVEPTAKRGKSSENDVYLFHSKLSETHLIVLMQYAKMLYLVESD